MDSQSDISNPIIIIPGVGLWSALYEGLRRNLVESCPAEKIFIADISLIDWVGFPPSPERSTNRVMVKLNSAVQKIRTKFPEEPITLVAHSGGGTVALIYLLEENFQGDKYDSIGVAKLLTLGTPFQSIERYSKLKTDFITQHLTEDFFKKVNVISIAGNQINGMLNGSVGERAAYQFYKSAFGDGELPGDGIVPVSACYLNGAKNVIIDGSEHLPTPFSKWYGTKESIVQWKIYL
jgi:pimeloyl-ACP methyl ester carboxylesterase